MKEQKKKKIKVLQFELFYKTGGIESFLLNLYKSIDRERVEFHVVSPYYHPENWEIFEELGGKVYKITHPKNIIGYVMSMDMLMKNNDYDIVHMNKCSAINILPVLIAWKNNIPIILHSHNSMSRLGKIAVPLQFINRLIIGKMSKIHLACSHAAARWMFGKEINYRIINNGIIVERFLFNKNNRLRIRKELGIPLDKYVFTNLGDLRKQKNPVFLIDIFAEIKSEFDSQLLIIGEGSLRKKVEQRVEEKGLDKSCVQFLGKRSDVPDLLSAVDGLIMPSLFEGLPMACVEAQASGVTLFLSDGISKEVELTNHVNWFSINEDPKKIALRIIDVCKKKPNDDERMRDNSIVRNKGFDMKNISTKMETIYRECMQ